MTPASRRRYGPILSILVPPALNIHITRLPGIKYAGQMNINPRWQVNRVDMHEFLCRPGEIFRRRLGYQGREGGGKSGFSQFFFPDNQWIFSWYNCAKIEGKIKSLPLFTKWGFEGEILGEGENKMEKGKYLYFRENISIALFFQLWRAKLFWIGYFYHGDLSRQIFSIIQRYIFIRNEIRRWKISVNIKVPFQKYLIFKTV